MHETMINDFSLLCRLFGNLFYRQPTDSLLAGTFQWLAQGGLRQQWALNTDAQSELALTLIEKLAHPTELSAAYQAIFADSGHVSTKISDYQINVAEFEAFRLTRDMPVLSDYDHVALLLLTASWIEDNLDSTAAQQALFADFLLPVMSKFLGKVEAQDSAFYRALAQLTREALAAMADELDEQSEN